MVHMTTGTNKRHSDSTGFGIFALDKKSKRLLPKRTRSCAQCQQRKVKCQVPEDGYDNGCQFCISKGYRCSISEKNLIDSVDATPTETVEEDERRQKSTQQQDPFSSVDWLKFMDEEISNNNLSLDYFLSINNSPGLAFAADWDTELDAVIPIDKRTNNISYMHYGPSGEYDPLLRYHYYQYDDNNECFFSAKFFRRIGTQQEPVIFAFKDRTHLLKQSKEVMSTTTKLDEGAFDRLSRFIPNFSILYLKFVFPSLPILDGNFLNEVFSNEAQEYNRNKDHIDLLLLLLLAKSTRRWDSYDTSIDMFADDDEILLTNRKELLTHAWNMLMDQIHAPDLATLKSLILFYHLLGFKKDAQSNVFEKAVLSNMVTMAYALGLHLDCTDWNIPKYEKNLRMRLWWVVYLMEKWGSFVAGSPSLINDSEFSVTMPKDFQSMFDDVNDYLNNEKGYIKSFEMALKLTFILNGIWVGLFSVGSLSKPKDVVLATCEKIEGELQRWRTDYFSALTGGLGNSSSYSLTLSCFILDITLFRARFRVLGISSYQELFFDKAKDLLRDIMEFLNKLPVSHIQGFWYRWSRSLFMYLKDFVLSLIVMSKTKEQSLDVLNLARQFREWLELNSRGLEILWTTLLRLNIATQSIGTQLKRQLLKDKEGAGD